MGNLCGKPPALVKDYEATPRGRKIGRASSELDVTRRIGSSGQESFRLNKKFSSGEIKPQKILLKPNGSRKVSDDPCEKNRENSGILVYNHHPGAGSVPKAVEGEQIAAGWPSWLASAAGEAIAGWIPRKADTFERLDKIGQGTYSSVYKARDLTHNKLVALKRVRFDNMDVESVKFMAREILILRRLNHPNIIKLEGLVTSRTSSSLHLVFEYMEHDLTGLAAHPDIKFTEPQVKCYMKQLLSGLDHCHSHGVLHRDIKGSNLLLDNNGMLKIADFGLATFFDPNRDIPLTSRVVTLWYRPLELLLGASHYGAAVDLWSAGCILGELYNGKPIMTGRTEVEQIHKIFKLCGSPSEEYWRKAKIPRSAVFKPPVPYKCHLAEAFKHFPAVAVRLMEVLLSIDPAQRGSAAIALRSDFFKTEPFACDPSCLPKYPPSKEIDAKLREEDAKRQAAIGVEGHKRDSETGGLKNLREAPVAPADAYITSMTQRRQGHPSSNSRSGILKPHRDEAARDFPVDPPRQWKNVKEISKTMMEHPPQKTSYSGPLGPGGWPVSGKKYEDGTFVSRNDLSTLSGLVAARTLPSEDSRDKLRPSHTVKENHAQESLKLSGESVVKPDQRRQIQNVASSRYTETRKAVKGPETYGHPSKGSKIHFSGPLGVPPNKVDQMLKDHDRQIQEVARRARLDKTRINKADVQHMQTTTNALYTSSYKAR